MDVALEHVETKSGELFSHTWSVWLDGSSVFEEVSGGRPLIDVCQARKALVLRAGGQQATLSPEEVQALFDLADLDRDGFINKEEFEVLASRARDLNASPSVTSASL